MKESIETAAVCRPETGDTPLHGAFASGTERGTTLVELVVASVVVVCTLVAILSVCVQHGKLRRTDDELTLAYLAARTNLEEASTLTPTEVAKLDGRGFDVPARNGVARGLRAVPGDPDGLAGEFRVDEVERTAGEVLYRIRATVTWTGVFREQRFALQTLYTARQ